jgi:C_GCAxxG_C_C family probable redox protein
VIQYIKSKLLTARPAPSEGVAPEELARLAAGRAENLFQNHALSCSEAVLLVLNRGFGGGLSDETCLGLGSGFGGGIGNSGCVCGALSGAVMALGLFLGPGHAEGLGKKDFRRLAGDLHDRFRERSGSVCCRELIADFRSHRSQRRLFCQDLTGWIAEETARLILTGRQGLVAAADREFLAGRDSRLAVLLDRVIGGKPVFDK